MREKLQALGYVGTAAPHAASAARSPIPRTTSRPTRTSRRGLSLRLAGRREEAVAQLRKVVRANPDMRDAWEMLGVTLDRARTARRRRSRPSTARSRSIRPAPSRTSPWPGILALDGRRDAALQHAEIAARREPGKGYEMLAQVLLDLSRADEAAAAARRSLEADPQRAMSQFVLGVVAQKAGRYEEALAAVRARPRRRTGCRRARSCCTLHARMADCLARLGREAEAEKEFLAEIAGRALVARGARGPRHAVPLAGTGRRGAGHGRRAGRRAARGRTPRPTGRSSRTFALLGDEAAAREWAARARAKFPGDARFR